MQWSAYFAEAASQGGVDMQQPGHLEPLLRSAGFIDITKLRLRLPFTAWGGECEAAYGAHYGRIFDWAVSLAPFEKRSGWAGAGSRRRRFWWM